MTEPTSYTRKGRTAKHSHWRTSPSTADGSGAAGSCALTTRRLCAGLALLKGLSRAARELIAVLIVMAAILSDTFVLELQGIGAEMKL